MEPSASPRASAADYGLFAPQHHVLRDLLGQQADEPKLIGTRPRRLVLVGLVLGLGLLAPEERLALDAEDGEVRGAAATMPCLEKQTAYDAIQRGAVPRAAIVRSSVYPGDQLVDVETVRDGVAALPIRREAHGRVVGQGSRVVDADARVDMP
jgi:hypothetical protein